MQVPLVRLLVPLLLFLFPAPLAFPSSLSASRLSTVRSPSSHSASPLFAPLASVAYPVLSPSSFIVHSAPITVTLQTLDVRFPQFMRFTVQASSSSPITDLRLTVWQRGVALGTRFTPDFSPAPTVRATVNWSFQSFTDGGYLPPGTQGEYTWHIQDRDGNQLDTPRQSYTIADRTQPWQSLTQDDLTVNWHAGNSSFGQSVLARAVAAHDYLTQQLGIQDSGPLQVFIYADKQDFFNSLPPFSPEWTGGRTFPEFGVIMINFAPDNLAWGLRATSHELSHAILHAKIHGFLGDLSLPHWLDEGLAVYNETADHAPDDQFEATFSRALRRNALIPLRQIQDRFPNDSDQAELAYGQSYNVVRFMIQEYGEAQFARLLDTYQSGALPDDALVSVYGMDQDALENAWRKKIGAPPRAYSSSVLPTLAAQPTYEFSAAVSPTAPSASAATASPSPTLSSVPSTARSLPPSTTSLPNSSPALPTAPFCTGVLFLSGLVLFSLRLRRRDVTP